MKYDNDKLDYTLLPFDALEKVTKVLEFGAKKYSRDKKVKVYEGLSASYFRLSKRRGKRQRKRRESSFSCCLLYTFHVIRRL